MSWRHQLEAVLCAIFLLVSLLVVAMRSLLVIPANGQIKPGIMSTQDTAHVRSPNHNNTTTKAKDAPKSAPLAAQKGFDPRTDLGSLWDEGPAYDLSRDETDY
jgi:hypothetical protein